MTEEQIEAKKQFAGEKRTSMKRRDERHDYTERRIYMITLEVEGRRPIFGRLVGDAFAPSGSDNEPRIELSELGKAVQSEWMGIHSYFPQIEVMAVQMMPDHMHGILFVTSKLPLHLGQVISGFKAGCRKAMRALEAANSRAAAAKPQPTEKAAKGQAKTPEDRAKAPEDRAKAPEGQAKAPEGLAKAPEGQAKAPESQVRLSPQAAAPPLQKSPLFAKGYNDLILRSFEELQVWQNYLRDNPRRLLIKRACPELLRPFFDLRIGPYTFSGIGNRLLLTAPKRLFVRMSRQLSEQEVENEKLRYLEEARKGAVLVSPCISPGEKRVMRAAFDAGLPTIVIMENGFTTMSKPHGEQFYACSKGLLLMLSPWRHHNEKIKLTAEKCQQMNLMALEICKSNVQTM